MIVRGLKEDLVISDRAWHINYYCSAKLLCYLNRIEESQVSVKIEDRLTTAVQR